MDLKRYSKLLKLSQLIKFHETDKGISRSRCKGCDICNEIEFLESEIGTVSDNNTSLTPELKEKIKKSIRKGKTDSEITNKLNISYNTVKTYRQIVKKETLEKNKK